MKSFSHIKKLLEKTSDTIVSEFHQYDCQDPILLDNVSETLKIILKKLKVLENSVSNNRKTRNHLLYRTFSI